MAFFTTRALRLGSSKDVRRVTPYCSLTCSEDLFLRQGSIVIVVGERREVGQVSQVQVCDLSLSLFVDNGTEEIRALTCRIDGRCHADSIV